MRNIQLGLAPFAIHCRSDWNVCVKKLDAWFKKITATIFVVSTDTS